MAMPDHEREPPNPGVAGVSLAPARSELLAGGHTRVASGSKLLGSPSPQKSQTPQELPSASTGKVDHSAGPITRRQRVGAFLRILRMANESGQLRHQMTALSSPLGNVQVFRICLICIMPSMCVHPAVVCTCMYLCLQCCWRQPSWARVCQRSWSTIGDYIQWGVCTYMTLPFGKIIATAQRSTAE